jgi:predicted RNase H-like HicB family nuclease
VSEYHINLFYSDEDRAWVADIPDLDACAALGTTAEQALAEVEKARDLWLASARDVGKPIPVLRYRPAIDQTL